MKNSKNLKGRPIPDINETYKKYIKSTIPFTEVSSKVSKQKENKFSALNTSEKNIQLAQLNSLQTRLLEKSKMIPNYLLDYLLQEIYLARRRSIPLYSSYFLLFDFLFKNQQEAVAKLILSSILIIQLIQDNKLNQNNINNYQYFNLFYSSRSPGLERDKLILYDYNIKKHVIVVYKNNFWMINAFMEYDKMYDQINYILNQDLTNENINFCNLSTTNRSEWSKLKNQFIDISEKNKLLIQYLDQAMMIFYLEDKASFELDFNKLNRICWHSLGYSDKIVQFIILKDGLVAINTQEGIIDQSLCVQYGQFIKQLTNNTDITKSTNNNSTDINTLPMRLSYDLDTETKKLIKNYADDFDSNSIKLKTEILLYNDYSKDVIEKKGLAVDSYIQLALITTYYTLYNRIVPSRQFVYEKGFSFATTEWIRTTTKETTAFALAFWEKRIPRDLKIKLGLDVFKQYKKSSFEVIAGKSIDSHLTGILSILNPGEDLPDIFKDEIFKTTSHWVIDTYPIFFDEVTLSCHPPPCKHGISLTYIVRKSHIEFIAAGYQDFVQFFHVLIEVLKEMKDLFIEKERSRISEQRTKF